MDRNSWRIESPTTLEVDGVLSLRAGIVAGRIDVIVHDEAVTRIEVSELTGRPVEISLKDGKPELTHNSSGGLLGFSSAVLAGRPKESSVISIAVPAGTDVALRTVSGDCLSCGTADTSLDTVSGSLLADDTSGMLRVRTVSGEAIVRHHSGDLEARTVSGAATVSGYCDNVRVNSVSGEVTLDLLGAPHALDARTVSGNLAVRLPADVGIDVSVSSVSGALTVNDFRFSGRGRMSHNEPGSTGSSLTVRAHTVSGDVTLLHHQPEYLPESGQGGSLTGEN